MLRYRSFLSGLISGLAGLGLFLLLGASPAEAQRAALAPPPSDKPPTDRPPQRNPVPEPTAGILFAAGALTVAAALRRRETD